MTLLQDFNACIRNKWITSPLGVQYCVINDTLYFQCSDDGTSDWLFNLDFPATLYKDSLTPFYIHRGFKEMWHSVRDDVAKLEFRHIRGYSQGAVFACLAHEDYLYRNKVSLDTVTFGCPRFLWIPPKKVVNRFYGITQIKTYNDIVPRLPPAILGYKQVGRAVNLNARFKHPEGMPILSWASGHMPTQYRLNLELL